MRHHNDSSWPDSEGFTMPTKRRVQWTWKQQVAYLCLLVAIFLIHQLIR